MRAPISRRLSDTSGPVQAKPGRQRSGAFGGAFGMDDAAVSDLDMGA
jgi:hypothetical protein